MSDWQPIETAPRDGTEFQGWVQYSEASSGWHPFMRYHEGDFQSYDEYFEDWMYSLNPTHWMPRPLPPETTS